MKRKWITDPNAGEMTDEQETKLREYGIAISLALQTTPVFYPKQYSSFGETVPSREERIKRTQSRTYFGGLVVSA